MRLLKITTIILALSAMTFTLVNCKQSGKTDQQTETTVDQSGPEYTSEYVCPMHCAGSGNDEPGECPVCGMAYVKNEDHEMHQDDQKGHDHHDGEDHSGHNH